MGSGFGCGCLLNDGKGLQEGLQEGLGFGGGDGQRSGAIGGGGGSCDVATEAGAVDDNRNVRGDRGRLVEVGVVVTWQPRRWRWMTMGTSGAIGDNRWRWGQL